MKKGILLLLCPALFVVLGSSGCRDNQQGQGGSANGSVEVVTVNSSPSSMTPNCKCPTGLPVAGKTVTGKEGKSWNGYIYGSFTYWNGQVDGAYVATVNNSAAYVNSILPDVKTRPGFLAGLGFFHDKTGVDFNAQYTWFYNKDDKNSYTNISLTGADRFVGSNLTAGGSLANTFNRIDVYLSKSISFGDYFALVPGGGVVGNWSEFWYDRTLISAASLTTTTANKDHIWGAGPQFFITSKFHAPMDNMAKWARLALYTKGGLGMCWQQNQPGFAVTRSDATLPLFTKVKINHISPVLDGVMGLNWGIGEKDKSWGIDFQVEWTIQTWLYYTDVAAQSDYLPYTMQGLTAGLGLVF